MEVEPDAAPSHWPRIALAVLVASLLGALAYILLQGQGGPGDRAAAPAAKSSRAAAPAAVAALTDPSGATILTAEQHRAMRETLAAAPSTERKAWFQVQANNPNSGPVQGALQQVFESAGWTTETIRSPYGLKSGIFILAADEEPPPLVQSVNAAFGAAGIEVQYLTGYRAFFTDRKEKNPNWVGPELASNQPFVIVVGSRPTPRAAP
jgi:hypothetical protein